MNYVDEFLKFKCSGDVLNVVNPIGKKSAKEISETMAVIKYIKRITLKEKMKYWLLDLCAGNALTSVLAAHLLPITEVIAIDKRPRNRNWSAVKRFEYIFANIHDSDIKDQYKGPFKFTTDGDRFLQDSEYIICQVHGCGNLARRAIDIYNQDEKARHLVLMPCCVDNSIIRKQGIDKGLFNLLSKYQMHTYSLAKLCGGSFVFDKYCLSPRNGVVVASK